MKPKEALFGVLAVILGGCTTVSTVQPLYSEKDVTFEQKLLGVWSADPNDPGSRLQVERLVGDANNAYKLTFSDVDGRKGVFELRLVRLEGQLYFDITPAAFPSGEDIEDEPYAYNGFYFVRLHTFGRIEAIEPVLAVRLSSESRLKEFLRESPDTIEHTLAEENKLLITAPTDKLQAFVVKYKHDERLFAQPIKFCRIKTGDPGCSTEEGQDREDNRTGHYRRVK